MSLAARILVGVLWAYPAYAAGAEVDVRAAATRVADAVCGREIVLLGELPSHGEAHTFAIKANVVQQLVERCGFDAVLFEAPIYDFLGFNEGSEQYRHVAVQMDRAIGRFWWTRELAGWREWLFRRATERGLLVGGLDDQVSATSEYARATLPGLIAATSPGAAASVCQEAVARHLYWRYDPATPFDEAEQRRLEGCVRDAADAAAARPSGDDRARERVMLENLASYVARQRSGSPAPDRDEAMHRNALWHLLRMPAGSKVIIWTATVHASRAQGTLPYQPLGARLAALRGADVAAIGFTALGGSTSMAGRAPRPLPHAPTGSLEARALDGGAAWAFLDTPELRRIGRAPSRLFGTLAEAEWSILFDGVVVIRDEVAPLFDPWK